MNRALLFVASAGAMLAVNSAAQGQVALKNNYISSAVGTAGTLGSGGNTSPGLIHDPTGKGAFDPNNDYITPGVPHQGFAITSTQSGYQANDNNGAGGAFGSNAPTVLTGAAAMGFASAVSWTGSSDYLTITNSYFLNPGDQRILVSTTLTALRNLTGLAFATGVDPDPDELRYGTFNTVNQRGNSVAGIDDFVGSAGVISGLTLAILNVNANGYAHSTQINLNCCSTPNPNEVLNHTGADAGTSGTGDYGLALAYNIGTLNAGSSATFSYEYAVGDAIGSTGAPTPAGAAPEPGTWAMLIFGFGLVGLMLRRLGRRTASGAGSRHGSAEQVGYYRHASKNA